MIGFYNYTVILTYLGFASGTLGVILSVMGAPVFWAVVCLMISGLCDAFDGRVARTRKRTEDEKLFGIQIDSLSDLVCFGVLPGVIGYRLGMAHPLQIAVIVLYILAALIRLAYFNVLEMNKPKDAPKMYHGLPVTSAALIFPVCYGLKLLIAPHSFDVTFSVFYTIVMLLTCTAFVSNVRFKKPGTKGLLFMICLGVAEIVVIVLIELYIRGLI
jgi:CDP-diacylglycerol--serine O-phosphatidyltransferase